MSTALAATDVRAAAALLRRLRSADACLNRKLRGHAVLLDRAAAHFDTFTALENAMRTADELVKAVVADLTATKAANAAKDARIAELEGQLAAAQAATVSPELLEQLDTLEPEAPAVAQATPADAAATPAQ